MSTIRSTLREWAAVEVVRDRRIEAGVGVSAFILATAFGAYIVMPLPWTPVPMTLQPLFALLAGAVLGPLLGAGAMAGYLALGASGAPVFAGGGAGLVWLLGPTGGYLLAFPAAAFVVGWLARGGEGGRLRLGLALVAGLATLYLGGIAHLGLLTGADLPTLLALGVTPFLAGDAVKLALAFIVAERLAASRFGT